MHISRCESGNREIVKRHSERIEAELIQAQDRALSASQTASKVILERKHIATHTG